MKPLHCLSFTIKAPCLQANLPGQGNVGKNLSPAAVSVTLTSARIGPPLPFSWWKTAQSDFIIWPSGSWHIVDWQISSSYLKVLYLEEGWIFEQKYHILDKKKKDLDISKNLLLRFGVWQKTSMSCMNPDCCQQEIFLIALTLIYCIHIFKSNRQKLTQLQITEELPASFSYNQTEILSVFILL